MKYESIYEKLGRDILDGQKVSEITLKGKTYKFSYTPEEFVQRAIQSGWPLDFAEEQAKLYIPVQSEFISDFKSDFCLNSGGFGSGKSIATYIKLILSVKCFPGNRVLLGRKTMADIDRAVLPELFDLMPPTWYEHRVKDGLINFANGSQIILFGLDSMQSGTIADIKKAQQKLKSLNLGGYYIDQLEEVEYEVIEVLNSRLRRTDVPFRQGNSNCNPANFWAYHQFKKQQKWNGEMWEDDPESRSKLYESSMLYNPHLPWDYIRKQMGMGSDYVRRFVRGEWTTDVLLKGTVFAREHIQSLDAMVKNPISVEEGCEIYEPYRAGLEYRMGVDPSEGVVDPSSISVVSSEGKKVAKFNGKLPLQGLADRVKFLYYKYGKPLIIPESNAAGAALIRDIRDLRVYRRKHLDYKQDKETEKLGFRMSWDSKQQLINHFQKLLRDRTAKVYDRKTVEEMKSFMWTDEASMQGAGAARGFHDDDIISTMLAFWEFNPEKVVQHQAARSQPVSRKRFQYG
jgi:phage terminase large subunit